MAEFRASLIMKSWILRVFKDAGLSPVDGLNNGYFQTFNLIKKSWKEVSINTNGRTYNQFDGIIFFGEAPEDVSKETKVFFGGLGDEDDLKELNID